MTWLDLWRWYVANCVWICPNTCTEASCCDCCIWAPNENPRLRRLAERLLELGIDL